MTVWVTQWVQLMVGVMMLKVFSSPDGWVTQCLASDGYSSRSSASHAAQEIGCPPCPFAVPWEHPRTTRHQEGHLTARPGQALHPQGMRSQVGSLSWLHKVFFVICLASKKIWGGKSTKSVPGAVVSPPGTSQSLGTSPEGMWQPQGTGC